MSGQFICGGGCGRKVKAIYCPECRSASQARLAQMEASLRESRSEAMKERWRENPELMKRKGKTRS